MDSIPHKIVWRCHQRSLEKKGALFLVAGAAGMLALACVADYQSPAPVGDDEVVIHRGLMDWIWHLRVPLWEGTEGLRAYLPYEYVFYAGMMVVGIGITLVVMGAMPEPEVSHLPDTNLWTWMAHDC